VNKPSKTLAFLAYLLSILGWLYVLLFHKKDKFAVYHARQSMTLTILAVVAPAVWALVAWILTWIPLAGSFVAATLFSLVIAVYVLLAVVWIMGMVYALQDKMEPLPMVGGWTERLLAGSRAD
jgi:uncharacterized membrane protein